MRKANVHDWTGLTSRTITNVEKLLRRREESFEDNHSYFRVRTGPGKPGKSWKFKISKSRPGKPGKYVLVLESPGKLDFS